MRSTFKYFIGVPVAVVIACDSAPVIPLPSNLPPRICKSPQAPAHPWFHDVTAEVGLAPSVASTCSTPGACDAISPFSSVAVASDLDGDGWVDFITTAGSAERGQNSSRIRALYM